MRMQSIIQSSNPHPLKELLTSKGAGQASESTAPLFSSPTEDQPEAARKKADLHQVKEKGRGKHTTKRQPYVKHNTRAPAHKASRLKDTLRPELHSIRNWVYNLEANSSNTPRCVLVHLSLSFDILAQIPELLKQSHLITYTQRKADPDQPNLLKGQPTSDVADPFTFSPDVKYVILYNAVRNLSKDRLKELKELGLPILCITKTSRTKKREKDNARESHLGKLLGLYNRVQHLGITHLYTTVTNPESAHPSILNPVYPSNAKQKKKEPSKKKSPSIGKTDKRSKPVSTKTLSNSTDKKPQPKPAYTNKAQIETLYAGKATDAKATIQVQKRTRVSTASQGK